MARVESQIRTIAILITAILGFFMLLEYFVVWPEVNTFATNYTKLCTGLLGLAGIVGVGNLTRAHLRNIRRRGTNWVPSVLLIFSLWVPLLAGLLFTRTNSTYVFMYEKLYLPISGAFFAILAFYIVSGSYRAFRARNIDSGILLLAGILVFMGQSPVTGVLWPGFQDIGRWIMDVPNAAGIRGITIGMAIGGVVTALRVLIGRERRYLAARGGA